MIKWFKDIKSDDFQLVGGKGFNLSQMYQSHINVPNGFVVLSSVYDDYINNNKIEEKINDLLVMNEDLNIIAKEIKKLFNIDCVDEELKSSSARDGWC